MQNSQQDLARGFGKLLQLNEIELLNPSSTRIEILNILTWPDVITLTIKDAREYLIAYLMARLSKQGYVQISRRIVEKQVGLISENLLATLNLPYVELRNKLRKEISSLNTPRRGRCPILDPCPDLSQCLIQCCESIKEGKGVYRSKLLQNFNMRHEIRPKFLASKRKGDTSLPTSGNFTWDTIIDNRLCNPLREQEFLKCQLTKDSIHLSVSKLIFSQLEALHFKLEALSLVYLVKSSRLKRSRAMLRRVRKFRFAAVNPEINEAIIEALEFSRGRHSYIQPIAPVYLNVRS